MHIKEMMPGLGEKYGVEIEVVSKPRGEYTSAEHSKTGLPLAPAIIIGEEVLVEQSDLTLEKLESAIQRALGIAEQIS